MPKLPVGPANFTEPTQALDDLLFAFIEDQSPAVFADAPAVRRRARALALRLLHRKRGLRARRDHRALKPSRGQRNVLHQPATRVVAIADAVGGDNACAELHELDFRHRRGEWVTREAVEPLHDQQACTVVSKSGDGLHEDRSLLKRRASAHFLLVPGAYLNAIPLCPGLQRGALRLDAERLSFPVGADAQIGDRLLGVACPRRTLACHERHYGFLNRICVLRGSGRRTWTPLRGA